MAGVHPQKVAMCKTWEWRSPSILSWWYMDVSKNRGTPRSSILIGFSIITHPFWGTPILETSIWSIWLVRSAITCLSFFQVKNYLDTMCIYIYIYELRTKASHYRRMPILYGMQVELWTLHIWWYCQVIHHRMLEHHPSFIGMMLTNALKTSNVFRACCVKKETHSASVCWKEIWLQVKLLQVSSHCIICGNSPKNKHLPYKMPVRKPLSFLFVEMFSFQGRHSVIFFWGGVVQCAR